MSMQRWNFQPVLSNVTSRRNCRQGEIKERQLLSSVSITLPPLPKTPWIAEALTVMRGTSQPAGEARQVGA